MSFWHKLVPKRRFQWKEPKPFRLIKDQHETERLRAKQPLFVLLAGGAVMANWYLARFNPKAHPPSLAAALAISLLAGVLVAYGLPWIISKCPAYVSVYEDMIARSQGNANGFWKFKDIRAYGWRSRPAFHVLVLTPKRGRPVLIGVPPDAPISGIDQFLSSKGLPKVTTDLLDLPKECPFTAL